jgi:hypothetical protein
MHLKVRHPASHRLRAFKTAPFKDRYALYAASEKETTDRQCKPESTMQRGVPDAGSMEASYAHRLHAQ